MKDTENGGWKNDEGLLLIQTEINLRSIMRMIMNENETIFSRLGRKSTESGIIYMHEIESVPRRSTIVRNR